MTDINNALQKLNVLNSKKNKNSIDKLINLIKTNQKTNKSFSPETAFAPSVLSEISTQIMFEKIIEFLIKAFKIMHFNSARQSSSIKYKESLILHCIDSQLLCLLMLQSISNKY